MQILRIHIENFGKLHGFDMEFQAGLNRIRAANGWGKSTLAAFLKAMFYGLEATTKRSLQENERKKYLPWQGGAYGGSLEFSAGEKRYRAERFFGAREKEDTFRLFDLDTGLESRDFSERLGEELFRLDRTGFERSSYFAQQDFQVTANDSLSARLSRVEEDAGDMQNYEKAYALLENRMKYYRKTGDRGQIPRIREARRQALEELELCRTKEKAWEELKGRISIKEAESLRLQMGIAALEEQARMENKQEALAARLQRLDEWKREAMMRADMLRETQEKLEAFDPPPPEEEELDQCQRQICRLQELMPRIAEEEAHVTELNRQAEGLRRENKSGGGAGLWLLAGGLLFAGIGMLLMGQPLFGGLLLMMGLLSLAAVIVGEGRKKSGRQESIRKIQELQEQRESALEKRRAYEEETRRLREEIQSVLMIEESSVEGREHALEEALYTERRRSRQYMELLRDYGRQKREARDSRAAYEQLRAEFSEEDMACVGRQAEHGQENTGLEQGLQGLRERREATQKEITRMQDQLQMLSEEAERIPELEEEAERLRLEQEAAEREHRLLGQTLQYLKEARDRFSARYLERLQRSFRAYFKQLRPEGGAEPVLDVKLQVRIPEAGASRELAYFSAGEQDLIRIAERFAIVDAIYEREQPVLILDDPFVNLDRERQERALRFLEERAEKWQMIYFTCRE